MLVYLIWLPRHYLRDGALIDAAKGSTAVEQSLKGTNTGGRVENVFFHPTGASFGPTLSSLTEAVFVKRSYAEWAGLKGAAPSK
jgi:hypothetical protein